MYMLFKVSWTAFQQYCWREYNQTTSYTLHEDDMIITRNHKTRGSPAKVTNQRVPNDHFVLIIAFTKWLSLSMYIYIYIYVWKLKHTVLELDFRAVKFCSSLDGIWTHTIDTLQYHSLSLTFSALDHSTTSTPLKGASIIVVLPFLVRQI
jgi:hypothetical protein